MASVSYYKNSKNRKDKEQLELTNRWKIYIDSFMEKEFIESYKMSKEFTGRLHRHRELMGFYRASLDYLYSQNPEIRAKFRRFIRENKSSWIDLGLVYRKKNEMIKAYFAFVYEQLRINEAEEYDGITEIMLEFCTLPSIYCRENALKALYAFGNINGVLEAFKRLSKNNIIHNRKLVTDGLLLFKGNKEQLAQCLYDEFDEFSIEYQVAFIDFFRFAGEKLKYKLIDILEEGDMDKEVTCALLRYYRKYPVMEYKQSLLSPLNSSNTQDWECIASAASTLGKYPGNDTINALKELLSSKYWYVRLNSARSIGELGVKEEKLTDIIYGNDQYAKEQLLYQLTYKRGLI